jgi:DHA1 family tetracycline resistance protein-like MFS transporter
MIQPSPALPAPATRHAVPFIIFTIFIDAVGFGIIMPVLPQLVMQVGNLPLSAAIEVGAWIGFVMAVATFFAAPVLGNLSDAFGRRTVLLIALAGMAIDYVLLSIAATLPLLIIARAMSGIFGGSYGAAQAAIADVTRPEERARNFGFVGAAFGMGFIAGPVIGGLLGAGNPRLPFIVAAVLAGVNFIYGLTLFPDTLAKDKRRRFDWRRANPFGALKAARAMPSMLGIAAVLTMWQIASLVYPMTWTWYGIAQFGWDSRTIGLSLAAVGVVIALSQSLLTGPAVKRLGERNAASVGLLAASVVFIGYAFATQAWMAFALMIGLALQSLVQPSLMAMMSRRATPETQGEVQGISSMAMGVGNLIAPLLLTGTMAHFTGPRAPVHFPGAAFLVAAGFGLAALALMRLLPRAGNSFAN